MRPGIFAKTFARPTLAATLDAVAATGLGELQFNLALLGGPSLPERVTPEACAETRAALSARGLSMAAVSGTYNMAHPDPAVRERGRRGLAARFAAAGSRGTTVVTVCTGTRDPEDMWRAHPANGGAEAWRDMLASMAAAAETAEAHDVVVLGLDAERDAVRDAPAARRLLAELRSPSVGIVVDAANLVVPGESQAPVLRAAFALLGADLVLAHAKDVRRDGTVVAAGAGTLDYGLYVELLEAAGYTGPLVLHGLAEHEVPDAVAFLRLQLGE